jgi:site-specific recombinase XerD
MAYIHYEWRLEHALAALDEDKIVSKKNNETILSYIKYRNAQGLSIPRQVRCISSLRNWQDFLKGRASGKLRSRNYPLARRGLNTSGTLLI